MRTVVAPTNDATFGEMPLRSRLLEKFAERRPGRRRYLRSPCAVDLLFLHPGVERPHRPAFAEHLERDALADVALRAAIDEQRLVGPAEHVDEAGRDSPGPCASSDDLCRVRPGSGPMATMRSPRTAMAADTPAEPVPSNTWPLRISRSYSGWAEEAQAARSRTESGATIGRIGTPKIMSAPSAPEHRRHLGTFGTLGTFLRRASSYGPQG